MTNYFFRKAFTLAETLIVIGIIGVIAMLTIPTLNSSVGDKESITRLKKEYAILTEAHDRAVAVYGPVSSWFINDSDATSQTARYGNRLTEFLKLAKNCEMNTGGGCFNAYNNIADKTYGTSPDSSASEYKFLLADGGAVSLNVTNPTANSTDGHIGNIYIDINGTSKGTSTRGKDVFEFLFFNDRIAPANGDDVDTNCFKNGQYCAKWIIQNDNMDYLKATNGTCPNGKALNWNNQTSCK